VQALTKQAGTLNTHTRYLHDTILGYAEKLLATFPDMLGHVMFPCTGSEANDLAMRIAKAYTSLAYHGITDAIAAISPSLCRRSATGLRAHGRLYGGLSASRHKARSGDARQADGNGRPIAGVVMRPQVVEDFGRKARYFNTFGGNPVSCAAGLAVLEVIEREGLLENARTVGACLREGLQQLAQRHDVIGGVRGAGFFVGAELVRDRLSKEPDAETTTYLANKLREKRILISAAGPNANVLKVRPPLVFSKANADMFLSAVDESLSRTQTQALPAGRFKSPF
jgi:4-aminobutyrate aminotransferase-like enzyme